MIVEVCPSVQWSVIRSVRIGLDAGWRIEGCDFSASDCSEAERLRNFVEYSMWTLLEGKGVPVLGVSKYGYYWNGISVWVSETEECTVIFEERSVYGIAGSIFDFGAFKDGPSDWDSVCKKASCLTRKAVKGIEDYAYLHFDLDGIKSVLSITERVRQRLSELDKRVYANSMECFG